MPTEPRNMNFIMIGLCIKGEVMYQLDTIKQVIKPGDILIVSDRHIVDSYQHSEDMEGLCMVWSCQSTSSERSSRMSVISPPSSSSHAYIP